VAIRTLSDPEEAADALQDAMISAFRRAESFRGDSAVTTWLHRIVVNACLDRLRRKAARPAADERVLDSLAVAHSAPDPSASSDTSLDVMSALRTLPPDQQAALVLVDMLGYPVADAADVLGVSQGTVKSRCSRGRARLLPRLAHLRPRAGPRPRDQVPGPASLVSEPTGRGAAWTEERATKEGGASKAPGGEREARNRSAAGDVQPAREGGDDPP
jgi:RNA polymerase sigma-70 factor, ECF subfamily